MTSDSDGVSISFLEVGQGDATLVTDHGTRRSILIDCPRGREQAALDRMQAESSSLELAIITHLDLDHSGGISPIVRQYPEAAIYLAVPVRPKRGAEMAVIRDILALARRQHGRLAREEEIEGSAGRVSWRICTPSTAVQLRARTGNSNNRASLRIEVSIAADPQGIGRRLLVVGDADGMNLRDYVAERNPKCDFFLWPHHGGAVEDNEWLLESVCPEVVVISAGTRNSYHHPNQTTIDAIKVNETRLLCTQVTPLCHQLDRATEVPCGGTVTINILPDGTYQVAPNVADHAGTIASWTHARCMVGGGCGADTSLLQS